MTLTVESQKNKKITVTIGPQGKMTSFQIKIIIFIFSFISLLKFNKERRFKTVYNLVINAGILKIDIFFIESLG